MAASLYTALVRIIVVVLLAGVLCAAQTDAPVNPRSVSQRARLSKAANGFDAELQITEDRRLTPALRKELWGMGDLALGSENPRASQLSGPRLLNAVLRIVRSDGGVVESEELERPLARFEHARLYGAPRDTFLLTVDYSAGWGSYSGPITFAIEVSGGHLHWIEAIDGRTGKASRIALMRSLKTTWKVEAATHGGGMEFLEAACRPDFGDVSLSEAQKFRLIFTRYFFDGKKWVSLTREEPGFWEFQGGFPKRSHFP